MHLGQWPGFVDSAIVRWRSRDRQELGMYRTWWILLLAVATVLPACEAARAKVVLDALVVALDAASHGDGGFGEAGEASDSSTNDTAVVKDAPGDLADSAAMDSAADLFLLDTPADAAVDAPVTESSDVAATDVPLPATTDTATTDTFAPVPDVAAVDTAPCTGPTCKGAAYPAFALEDFQPKSAGFKTKYGLAKFTGKVTVVALHMGW
jgi:hypothetical protein